MTIEERLKYAEGKRDDAVVNGSLSDIVFWNGYIEGIKAVQRDG